VVRNQNIQQYNLQNCDIIKFKTQIKLEHKISPPSSYKAGWPEPQSIIDLPQLRSQAGVVYNQNIEQPPFFSLGFSC